MKMIKINLLFFVLLFVMPMLSFSAEEVNSAQQQLWEGAKLGDVEMVRKALAAGADIDKENEKEDTVLDIAMKYARPAVIELLLDSGVDVNEKDEDGYTLLTGAAMNGQVEIVKLLLARKADVNAKTNEGSTALMYAASSPSQPKVKNPVRDNKDMPVGAFDDDLEIVKLLVKAGADLNLKDELGETALMWAIGRNLRIVEFLVQAGANPMIKDGGGMTAKNIAERGGLINTVKAIDNAFMQRLIKEQGDIDPISMENITYEPSDKLIVLGEEHPYLFLKKTIMNHMISKVGSEEGILDPFTRKRIPDEVQQDLLEYFSLPADLLRPGGPIYHDAVDLQVRENLIVMRGEPETEEGRKELDELKDEAAFYRKRLYDTLARYNYNYAE